MAACTRTGAVANVVGTGHGSAANWAALVNCPIRRMMVQDSDTRCPDLELNHHIDKKGSAS